MAALRPNQKFVPICENQLTVAGFHRAHLLYMSIVHVTYTVTKCAHMRFTESSLFRAGSGIFILV